MELLSSLARDPLKFDKKSAWDMVNAFRSYHHLTKGEQARQATRILNQDKAMTCFMDEVDRSRGVTNVIRGIFQTFL